MEPEMTDLIFVLWSLIMPSIFDTYDIYWNIQAYSTVKWLQLLWFCKQKLNRKYWSTFEKYNYSVGNESSKVLGQITQGVNEPNGEQARRWFSQGAKKPGGLKC